MHINWYSFYHKLRTVSIVALSLCMLNLIFNSYLGENNMFGTSPSDSVPYVIATLIATIFSWGMVVKYESLRGVPEVTSKKASRLYGTIAIILISLFLLSLFLLPQILSK